jgi:hypothetical protein
MPYNEEIDARLKQIVSKSGWKNTDNKKMFGGVCHLLNGNMFCGDHKDFLILRLGEENVKNALALPFVRPFDITGDSYREVNRMLPKGKPPIRCQPRRWPAMYRGGSIAAQGL